MWARILPALVAQAAFAGCISGPPNVTPECAFQSDGGLTEALWSDVAWQELGEGVRIAMLEMGGQLCIGVDVREAGLRYVDIFVSDGVSELHNLHASMQVGERRLPEVGWTDATPETSWGQTTQWRANHVTLIAGANDRGVFSDQVAPYDGYEIVIELSRMPRPWRMRVEVRDFEGARQDVVWPEGSARALPQTWGAVTGVHR